MIEGAETMTVWEHAEQSQAQEEECLFFVAASRARKHLRFYLAQPGRSIGKLAWIPSKVVPWVGAGGGMMYYRFLQQGDFVDFKTTNVFPSSFESSDWTYTYQGMGGADISLSPHVALRADARYLWAKAQLSRSFTGFDRIDLSGAQATLGLTYRL